MTAYTKPAARGSPQTRPREALLPNGRAVPLADTWPRPVPCGGMPAGSRGVGRGLPHQRRGEALPRLLGPSPPAGGA